MSIEWIGIAAGFLTTCAFLPQVAKTVRSRSTGDLSWIWLVMMSTVVDDLRLFCG
jgi:MtN3 and saliva related transmembrane protein